MNERRAHRMQHVRAAGTTSYASSSDPLVARVMLTGCGIVADPPACSTKRWTGWRLPHSLRPCFHNTTHDLSGKGTRDRCPCALMKATCA